MLTAYPPREHSWPAVVLLQETDELRAAPIAKLTEALAGTLADEFGDAVLLLSVVGGNRTPKRDQSGTLTRLTLAAGRDPDETIRRALNEHALNYAYTLLDVTALPDASAFTKQLIDYVDRAVLDARLFFKLVRLRKRATRADACAALVARCARWHVLTTAVLPPLVTSAPAREHSRWRNLLGLFQRTPEEAPRADKVGESPETRWYEGCQNPEEVRVRMSDAGELGVDSLQRWARAISDRRFGLALGGSGAWGFAHAALIAALEDERIPIDLIGSASSGSVVGAYYCALGRPGIDQLLDQCWDLQLTALTCFFSMLPMERYIGRNTAFVQLRELELMFLPVATNLTKMQMECVTDASLAWGVRASSTAPGLFGSTLHNGSVYVDGAVSCNVPVDLVKWRGADLAVAMNALPRPTGLKAGSGGIAPLLRLKQLGKSLGLVFQDMGDWEARGHLTFDAPRVGDPLLKTAQFYRGRQIYEHVRAHPDFIQCIGEIEHVWRHHAQPRRGLSAERSDRPHVPVEAVELGDGLRALQTATPVLPAAHQAGDDQTTETLLR